MDTLLATAQNLIAQNRYLTLSTVGSDGKPWVSPVFLAPDHFTFYWRSSKEARHSQNIRENSVASWVIFDSTVAPGQGQGVYCEGTVMELADPEDITHALKVFLSHLEPYTGTQKLRTPDYYIGQSPRRFYKAVAEKVWILGDELIQEHSIDIRLPVTF